MTLQSEADFLRLIDKHFPNPGEGKLDSSLDNVQLGRGDDCAIVHIDDCACLSSDIFLEDVHFRRSYFSPEDIGHKALAVNVSDIAAMGCVPRAFSLDLMVPKGLDEDYWNRLFTGMASLANRYGLILAGGDLSSAPMLGLTVHIWGTPGPTSRMLTRGNARPGDRLAVVGMPGLARAGLYSLEKQGISSLGDYPTATSQHLRPMPRVSEGLDLATIPGTRGLMDISDGLARDLPRFLALSEGKGAEITLKDNMIHREVHKFANEISDTPERIAFLGGEDYGLLTAISPDAVEAARTIKDLMIIGTVTEAPGITLNGTLFEHQGFDHFGG